MFRTQLRQGLIENIFQIALVGHHLIMYTRDTVAGRVHACHFAPRIRWQSSSAEYTEQGDIGLGETMPSSGK